MGEDEKIMNVMDEIFDCIQISGILPNDSIDTVDYESIKIKLTEAKLRDLSTGEAIAYLSATNPYKENELLKETRDDFLLFTQQLLLDKLKDNKRVENILQGLW